MSDLHFDPLYDPELVDLLIKSPASDWESIFENSGKKEYPGYGNDSNYVLLKSSLAAMQVAVTRPAVVIIVGDFLPHKFEERFKTLAKDQFSYVFEDFTTKTAQFLAEFIQRRFPNTQIIPVLGNNDSSCGNYMNQPRAKFLNIFAQAWESSVNHHGAAPDFTSVFSAMGHYSAQLKAQEGSSPIRMIVMNGTYGSDRYQNRCGEPKDKPNVEELAWLTDQLEKSKAKGEHVWLINHIPPGIDVAKTIFTSPNPCEKKDFGLMYQESFGQRYLTILNQFSEIITLQISSHTHYADFHLFDSHLNLSVPSIGPNHLNNPTFEVLSFDSGMRRLQNSTFYNLNLAQAVTTPDQVKWQKEFDFKQNLNMSGLSSTSFAQLLQQIQKDPKVRDQWRLYLSGSAAPPEVLMKNWEAYLCGVDHADTKSFGKCLCH